MNKNLKLLILEEPPSDERLGPKISRNKALNAISSSGSKIHHDSGGRLIIIEVSKKAEKALVKLLPGGKLESVDYDAKKLIADLDSNDSLFLEALKTRTSKSYRDAKKRRKVGETPEEKELISGHCIIGED